MNFLQYLNPKTGFTLLTISLQMYLTFAILWLTYTFVIAI